MLSVTSQRLKMQYLKNTSQILLIKHLEKQTLSAESDAKDRRLAEKSIC